MTYKITHKNSTVSGTPPTAGDIDVGEIAINAADAELYTKDANGNIKKFANTDTTGTAAGVQFTQTGTDAVQRTIESKLQDVVSVKDFGVVSDNGATDQSAKFQAALDYAATASSLGVGITVYIPAGHYQAGGLLIKQQGIRILGDGQYNTVITAKPGSSYVFATWNQSRNPGDPTKPIRHLTFEGFHIRNYDNLTSASGNGAIILAYGYNHILRDLSIVRQGSYANNSAQAIVFNTGVYTTVCDKVFADGVLLNDSTNADAVTTITFVSCDHNHVRIRNNSSSINFYGCTFQGFGSSGHPANIIDIDGGRNFGLYGCHFEGDVSNPVGVYARNALGVTIHGCYFYSLQGRAADTGACNDVSYLGNTPSATYASAQHSFSNTAQRVTSQGVFTHQTAKDGNYVGKLVAANQPWGVNAFDPDTFANWGNTSGIFLDAGDQGIALLSGGNTATNANYIWFGSLSGTVQSYLQAYSNTSVNLFVNTTRYIWQANAYLPGADNTLSLGTGGNRWSVVYAGTGTINTSDAREKQQGRSLSDAEKAAAAKAKGLLKAFKFNDAVEVKGDDARIHFGIYAQELAEAFAEEGLDAADYGMFCYDEWNDEYENVTEMVVTVGEDGKETVQAQPTGERKLVRQAGDRYGIRYEELLAFIIAAL
jgi:hypothetical protein